jgi:hypothetical protein
MINPQLEKGAHLNRSGHAWPGFELMLSTTRGPSIENQETTVSR